MQSYKILKFKVDSLFGLKSKHTWQAGKNLQGHLPRYHWPVKLVIGVRGAAVRHITMSEIDMLQTNKLIPVRRLGVLQDRQNYFLRNWKSFQILKPAYCDDNEKIPNSPNQRYQTVEDEEYDLDLLNIKSFLQYCS